MLWTDVRELCTYWREFPPVHEILAAVHMKPRDRRGEPNDAERQAEAMAGPARSLDAMPIHLQRALMERKNNAKRP